jgi:hypothetical protein
LYVNPTATTGIFTASIAWGDGATSPGTIQSNGYGGFDVVGNHTYSRAGTYSVHVGLKDIYGSSLAVDATAYASAAAQATTATGGRGLTGAVASPASKDPSAIDTLAMLDSYRALDEAVTILGGASKVRSRRETM